MSSVTYNVKTGNLLMYDRYILRREEWKDGIRFWFKYRGTKRYLCQLEMEDLKSFLRWALERGMDFGDDVNAFAA